ncbi:Regulatory protein GntR [Oleispira antarctica RB-8]|uniref:Regulatory protein GntR n=1 Tax=Oleispira antarctica RB-8 TaxID=698738 RepID=R4YRE8_OLEAN|nr:Regulatory protein GntR [Oleispira antarctica RB-8]
MPVKTLPDQITDLLIAFVFTGKLVPGDKLPPERQLAEYLGVDRTSLRMALRTLTRMNVVHTLQGSGIRVLDYKRDGGLDFLGDLFKIDELELGGDFLLSGLELFIRSMPAAMRMSVEKSSKGARNSQGRVLGVVHKMYQGMQNGDDHRQLATLEVELIDTLLESTDNVFMQVAGSSSRQIRQALTEKSYELIDVKAHLDFLVGLMMRIVSGVADMDDITKQYVEYIVEAVKPLKDYFLTLPSGPRLISSPLHNGKNIMDLDDIMKKNIIGVD